MKKYVVIVAGGKGLRMGAHLPKQFLLLQGLPVIMHTIKAFYECDSAINIKLVLPESHVSYWKELCTKFNFDIVHEIVPGGETRYHSVLNGLNTITDQGSVVAIHDAVRPLVSVEKVKAAFKVAEDKGSAVMSVPSKDSLRRIIDGKNTSVLRSEYHIIQTPQIFQTKLIKEAFLSGYKESFTDDASVLEDSGRSVCLVEGDYANIKITTPEDMVFAEAMMQKKATDGSVA